MCGWVILVWGLSCGCHQMVIETGTVEERLEQLESGQGTLSLSALSQGLSVWLFCPGYFVLPHSMVASGQSGHLHGGPVL